MNKKNFSRLRYLDVALMNIRQIIRRFCTINKTLFYTLIEIASGNIKDPEVIKENLLDFVNDYINIIVAECYLQRRINTVKSNLKIKNLDEVRNYSLFEKIKLFLFTGRTVWSDSHWFLNHLVTNKLYVSRIIEFYQTFIILLYNYLHQYNCEVKMLDMIKDELKQKSFNEYKNDDEMLYREIDKAISHINLATNSLSYIEVKGINYRNVIHKIFRSIVFRH